MKKAGHLSASATLKRNPHLLAELLKQEGISVEAEQSIRRRGGSTDLPLSSAQQRLWMLHQVEPQSAVYNIPMALRLRGRLHLSAFEQALNCIVARHEALRTTFHHKQGTPVQTVRPGTPLNLQVVDLERIPAEQRERHLQSLLAEEARIPFDLSQGPLFRAALYRLSPAEHVLLVNMHHIVSDGWSIHILMKEMTQLYSALAQGQEAKTVLPELPVQLADYAAWQQESLEGPGLQEQLAFWRKQLAVLPDPLELPRARRRPAAASHAGMQHDFSLPGEDAASLRQIAVSAKATPFMVFLAAFQILLYRYTRQSDIVVGSPVSGRTRVEIEPLIGFFVNTLVLRTCVPANGTFRDLLERTRETVLSASANQELPFEKIVEELQPGRDPGGTPLFQIMFAFDSHTGAQWHLPGLEARLENIYTGTAKFDLTLSITETPDGFSAGFEYATDLFDHGAIQAMESHYRSLLREIARDPNQRIAELPILPPEELGQILAGCNRTAMRFPYGKCLHEVVREQALRTLEAKALIFEDVVLTYADLDHCANQLAHCLVEKGVVPETRVALCMDRSPEMVISILATLKAGGAYVPLDPEYPQQRLALMLRDAAPAIILAQERFLDQIPQELRDRVLCPDRDRDMIARQPETAPVVAVDERNTAYVIYTSGSTGVPKGVSNEHRTVLNYLFWLQLQYALGSNDLAMLKTPYTFDVSVPEIFWTLMTGACLVISRPGGHKDPDYMVELIARHQITTVRFVPSMLQVFLETQGVERCTSLKRVICSGEALPAAVQKRFFERLPHVELINHYGPTEAAVEVTQWRCRAVDASIPIGYPAANTQLHILDQYLQVMPAGAAGELFIAGAQVARGYLNRPALTAEKFIPNPFSARPGERMYRTGDLTYRRQDGAIEFRGRLDYQVKLRGFRIELGEIESALAELPVVIEAVVIARDKENGEKYLVAYFSAKDERTAPQTVDLRTWLQQKLPDYMVPAVYVAVAALPRTGSGKIDRKSLPEPEAPPSETSYIQPHSPVQEMLAGIWARMLNTPRVGIHDNFFELGGHSLLAIRVASRIRDAFQVELPLQAFFARPTIAHLARMIDEQRESGAVRAEPIPRLAAGGERPLSYNQEGRLLLEWFSEIRGVRQPPFHAVMGLDWRGALDAGLLEAALNQMIERHEVLRTAFVAVKGAASLELLSALDPVVRRHGMQKAMLKLMELAPRYFKQRVCESARLKLQTRDLQHLPEDERDAEIARIAGRETQLRFDYEEPPLMRVLALAMGNDLHRIIITLHHLMTDVWSMEALIKELASTYQRLAGGASPAPPALPIQHSDFAAWQRSRLGGERLAALTAYWREQWQEIGLLDVQELGHRRQGTGECTPAAESCVLDPELCSRIKAFVLEQGITAYMLFLTGLYLLLHAYSDRRKIGVWGNFANRTRTETENLIGWLVNSHLLGIEIAPETSVARLLGEVKRRVLDAHTHQEIPYSLLWATALQDLNIQHHTDDKSASPYIMFDFHARTPDFESAGGPKIRLASLPLQPIQLALHFVVAESNQETEVSAHYDVQRFPRDAICRLLTDFERTLELVISSPETPISILCSSIGEPSPMAAQGQGTVSTSSTVM
jgi:amino acid adenylation domain-containing protein